MTEAQIFLGDYLRAVERLRPDDATRDAIAKLLGLDVLSSRPVKANQELPPPVIVPPAKRDRDGEDEETTPPKPVPPKPAVETGVSLKSRLTPVSTVSRSQVAQDLQNAAKRFPAVVAQEITPPAPEPLFHPRWTRGILTAALSTQSRDGPVDVEQLIESLSRREPMADLPRLSAPTMRRGLQLLVDMSSGMTPYAGDVFGFQKEIRLIVGEDAVEVLRFDGSPLRGAGAGTRRTWKDYQPPSSGTPVLALSDLGANQPAQSAAVAREWMEFAELLRHAECPIVVFATTSPARIPDDLARAIHIIQWDRATTAASVRRLVGRLLAVKR